MATDKITITAISSISPLGENLEDAWESYGNDYHYLTQENFDGKSTWIGRLNESTMESIEKLGRSNSKYKNLDNSVLYALLVSRNAIKSAGWDKTYEGENNFGINIGSSRGATGLFENFHKDYLKKGRTSSLTSPTTTLGNISSWVAHDLGTIGPEFSHSITCSTALHALLNGFAWLMSGMADRFLVGGSEAPLTSFTIAQMKALKIYSNKIAGDGHSYPCRAMDLDKKENTMVLGEGASMACLEKGVSKNSLAVIKGIGYATETLNHNVSISSDAKCFQKSMEMALKGIPKADVDIIVMHAPGTIKGDQSENNAIKKVFGEKIPFLTTNKWKTGHTFGASGMLSIELAVLMLQYQKTISVPYIENGKDPKDINSILVNAVGFGGNAVSILLSKV